MSTVRSTAAQRAAATDALMATSRLVTAVIARTLADVDHSLTVPQFRVLVMLHFEPSLNLGAIATRLGVGASSASRTCEKLVAAGWVTRTDDERDRRHLAISLSPQGRRLIDSLMETRRKLLDDLVAEMDPADQRHLARGLSALLAVLGDEDPSTRLGTRPGDLLPWVR